MQQTIQTMISAGLTEEQANSVLAKMISDNTISIAKKTTKKTTKKEKTEKKERKAKEPVTGENQCWARVWGAGKGCRCSSKKVGDSDYCGFHKKQAMDGEEALQWNDDGTKKGLHLGRWSEDSKPWRALSGEVCYAEFAPAGAIEALKESGEFKWHANVKQGQKESGVSAPKKTRATKAPKAKKETKTKKPRGKNAYFLFLQENRESIKTSLHLAASDDKVSVTDVTKKAGEMWKAIKDTDAAAKYHKAAAESKKAAEEAVMQTVETVDEKPITPLKEEEVDMTAEECLDILGIKTPSEEDVAAALEQAKKDGRFEEAPVEETEQEETNAVSDEEVEEEYEEIEYDGETYYKTVDGSLYQLKEDQEEAELVGRVDDEGSIEIF